MVKDLIKMLAHYWKILWKHQDGAAIIHVSNQQQIKSKLYCKIKMNDVF